MKFTKSKLLIAALGMSFLGANVQSDESIGFEQILAKNEQAIVTVKYLLAVSMGGTTGNMDQESESELSCAMASSEGLVICSNNQMTGFISMIKRFSGPAGPDISAVPKDLKVIISSNVEPYDATILAIDSELDMAWIQISDTKDQSFEYIDFENGAEADIGDEIIIIRRMGNHFGRAPVVNENRVGGVANKPRALMIPHQAFAMGGGLPVFNKEGEVIGLMITQMPDADQTGAQFAGMMGGGMANLQDAMSGLILPASQVHKATLNALQE